MKGIIFLFCFWSNQVVFQMRWLKKTLGELCYKGQRFVKTGNPAKLPLGVWHYYVVTMWSEVQRRCVKRRHKEIQDGVFFIQKWLPKPLGEKAVMIIIPLLFFDCPCGFQCGFTFYPVPAWGIGGQLGLCSSPPSTGKDGKTPGFQAWWLQLIRKLNSASFSPRSNQRTQSLSGMSRCAAEGLTGCFSAPAPSQALCAGPRQGLYWFLSRAGMQSGLWNSLGHSLCQLSLPSSFHSMSCL